MKPVLLLLPGQRRPSRERRVVDLRRAAGAAGVGDETDYASVIVVNDGRAGTVRRQQLALALRDRHRGLPIAVLTYLDRRLRAGADAILAAAGPLPVLAELGPELKVELRNEVLSLEYQAV